MEAGITSMSAIQRYQKRISGPLMDRIDIHPLRHLVAHSLEELPEVDASLDDILNRADVELDLDVWGSLLEE